MSYDPRKGGLYPSEVDKEFSNKMATERFKSTSKKTYILASLIAVFILVGILLAVLLLS